MPVYVTPGPDRFVVMRHAARSRRTGWVVGIGVSSGLLVHTTAAAAGVAALLVASAEAFTVLKVIGAAYLVHLGVRALASAGKYAHDVGSSPEQHPSARSVLRQSFLANVLNPKAAIFFVAVLPQFLVPGTAVAPQVLLLGSVAIALGLVWWFLCVLGIDRIQQVVNAERGRRVIDRVAGVCLIGLGAALAFVKPAAHAAS